MAQSLASVQGPDAAKQLRQGVQTKRLARRKSWMALPDRMDDIDAAHRHANESRQMVPFAEIDQFASRIAREFDPEKIILFGSHARGDAGPHSDVDLLVVMPFTGKGWRQAAEIRGRVRPSFALDLLVRAPDQMHERLRAGDPFLREIAEQGVELHAKNHARVGR